MLRASIVMLCLAAPALCADDPVFSGPQPGEKLAPFKVRAVLGPAAGKDLDIVTESKGAPIVLVFVHELTRPARQLLLPIDHYGMKMAKEGLVTHFVWLSADKAKTEEFLTRAQGSIAIHSPISVSPDGIEGPGNYGLNRKVAVTVLVAKDNKVVASFALVQPNETDAPKVLEATAKVLGKQAPTAEQLRAEADNQGQRVDPELGTLLRRMINLANDEATVRQVAQDMVKWAGDDARKKADLVTHAKRILKLGYGTDAAKQALTRLAGQ